MINCTTYIRKKKSEAMKALYEKEMIEKQTLCCKQYENAMILPIKADASLKYGVGGVISENGEYIHESGIKNRYGGYYDCSKIDKRDETVVYCGMLNLQWGYFLLETIATLWYVMENKSHIDKIVYIVKENESPEIKGNPLAIFELLGIADKIELINKPTLFSKVLLPERGYVNGEYFGYQFINLVDEIIKRALEKNPQRDEQEKIFLSRSHFEKAKSTEMGIELLDDFFERNGYVVLFAEELSIEELICHFYYATDIVTCAGTLAHNLILCRKGQKVTVIDRQAYINSFQIDIDKMRELNTTYLDANYVPLPAYLYDGPFMYGFNSIFRKYAQDREMIAPRETICNDSTIAMQLQTYYDRHRDNYKYSWGIESATAPYLSIIYEAYEDTLRELGEFILGERSVEIEHNEIWYLKKVIRMFLKRLRR